MRIYQNGVSLFMGGTGNHERAPRGNVKGWSAAAARRQRQWAWSVDSNALTGYGYAVTLTLAETPPSAVEWTQLRDRYLRRLDRMGAIRVHWVTEWQRRGTPHLHMAIYFDRQLSDQDRWWLLVHWLQVTEDFGSQLHAQDLKDISGSVGWLKYLAKHATRGVAHYQRQGHPEGWEKTGRLWGERGAWPVVEPYDLPDLNNQEFYRVRRIMRAWAYADARRLGDTRRMVMLKQSRRTTDLQKSRYLGAADWMPEEAMLRLVDYLERENVASS